MKELFQSERPQNDFIKKHIAYYYFHQLGKDSPVRSFIYYPHYQNGLTIYKNSEVTMKEAYTTVTKPKDLGYFFGFAKLTNHAAKAILHPPFNRIGVVFQPLGLNHFLEGDLSDYVTKSINLRFDLFKDSISETLDQVFKTDDVQEKVKLLDHYFLSVYQGFDSPKMEETVSSLLYDSSRYKVEELADKMNVSRKTLLRLFKRHHNCSVIDYIKMVQFRKSIEAFKKKQDNATLTELAHDTYYYDQSEFIKHFKKLTGYSPKRFFRDLTNLGSQDTYWTFN